MFTDRHGLKHKEVTKRVIKIFYEVYNELGFGFLESVYQESLVMALSGSNLDVCAPVQIPVWFRGRQVGKSKAMFWSKKQC
jgi:GxxExxY protein